MSDTSNPERTEAMRNVDAGHAFVTDVAEIRRRARQHIQDGAVTADHAADCQTVLRLLNEALATELVCVLRYKRHYYMAGGAVAEAIKGELLQHATDEQQHADQLAQRIVELGGSPNFNPPGLVDRSRCEYVEGDTLADTLAEDLIAERIAIESYREIIQYLGDKDMTTRRLFESILAVEEEHAEDLRSMREDMLRRERPVGAAHNGNTGSGASASALQ
jgi:bacterioferritin